MPDFELDQQIEEEIAEFIDEWFSIAPGVMGISETIAGCEVTNIDTYSVGAAVLPRYVTARVYEYTVPVLYRGFPTVALNDLVTVLHFREANRYEVIAISGNSGSSPTLSGTGVANQIAYWAGVLVLAGDAGLTYNAGTDTITLAGGLIMSGGASAVITVNDNVVNALTLVDVGATEYLRIITTDAQPIIRFNDGGVDIDFHVEAVGVADALQVQGADGQITLGALTLGYVRSSAGGILSVALEVPLIDLGSYTQGDIIYGGAADYQDLAIGAIGEVLTVNAAGTEPEWAEPAGDVTVDELHEHAWQEDWTAAANGVKVNFITANEFSEETTLITLNGSAQRAGTDYTEDALFNSMTFTVAPLAGDELITAYELA